MKPSDQQNVVTGTSQLKLTRQTADNIVGIIRTHGFIQNGHDAPIKAQFTVDRRVRGDRNDGCRRPCR